jgi:hypothetical protein
MQYLFGSTYWCSTLLQMRKFNGIARFHLFLGQGRNVVLYEFVGVVAFRCNYLYSGFKGEKVRRIVLQNKASRH